MSKAITPVLAALLLVISTCAAAVTLDNGGLLSPAVITINNQPGDQFDPHIDQDLAVYSNAVDNLLTGLIQEVRYYRFSTGIDSAIPNTLPNGSLANDLLSDVDQGRIVFTRVFPNDRVAIMLFDTTTGILSELAPAPASHRIGVAIGGQTVAFADYGLAGDGSPEIMVLDLTTSALTRLTNDTEYDANPAVSPDGNVVTWERCASLGNYYCDIYRASRSGSIWIIQQMSASPLNERSPDSNGTQIVFERDDLGGPTGSNIVLVTDGVMTIPGIPGVTPPMTVSGAETILEIPGEQYNPSIRGRIVAFESRVGTGNPDIYIADLAANRYFQITDTPTFAEMLNDVTVLPTGEVRLVWQAVDETDPNNGNIYAATFTLPGTLPPCTIAHVIGTHAVPCQVYTSVTGIPTGIGTVDISIISPAGASFAVLPTVGDNWPNVPGINFPVGTISFTAQLPAGMEGGDMTMTFVFTPPLTTGITELYKVVDNNGNIQAIDHARWSRTDTSTSTTITLTLTDGLFPLDLDGIANGLIVDPLRIGIVLNQPPAVLPTVTPNHGAAPLNAQFAANATDVNAGDVLSYSWNFGDPASGANNTSALINPLHRYASAGIYTATVTVSDGVNAPVSASLTISVELALTINVREAKVERGDKGKAEGKISMKADFGYAGIPAAAEMIRVKFDGVTLLDVPFGSFKPESAGKYEYETKALEAAIDFSRGTLKVSRHKMRTSGVDNSNGVDVEVSFGAATGTDHIDMTSEKDKRDGDLSYKSKR